MNARNNFKAANPVQVAWDDADLLFSQGLWEFDAGTAERLLSKFLDFSSISCMTGGEGRQGRLWEWG
jgi:hypothetical protein